MKIFLKFIKKEKILFSFLIFSLIFISLRFVLDIPKESENFRNLADIILNLSLGFIISYIFYFLVVFLKREIDQKNTNDYIAKRIRHILTNSYRNYRCFVINSRLTDNFQFPPSEDEMKQMFEKLDPIFSFGGSNLKKKYNWYELIKYTIVKEDLRHINEIFQLMNFIDSELIKILNSIKECKMFKAAEFEIVPAEQFQTNAATTDIPKRFSDYYKLIDELDAYACKNLSVFENFKEIRKVELTLNL